jgi:hypothetical protein
MSTQLSRSIEYLDTTIAQFQALLAELEGSSIQVPQIAPAKVEVAVLTRPEPILIKMKAGKGYGWLAAAINKAMVDNDDYTDLDGTELRKRMGSQMLYKEKVYRFEADELISGADLTGGLSSKQIQRAQKAAVQFKEDRAAQKTEKEIAEKLASFKKASVSMSLRMATVAEPTTEGDSGPTEEAEVEAEAMSLLEVGSEATGAASIALTGADLVMHGGKSLEAVAEHTPSVGVNALGKGVGVASVGFGLVKIADGLAETDTLEGVDKVLMGSMSVIGGAASTGMLGPASPVIAAGTTTFQVSYEATSYGDDVVKERGWLTDDQGNAESGKEQHLRHMVETEEALIEMGAHSAVATAAAYTRGLVETLPYGGTAVVAAGVDATSRAVDAGAEVFEDASEAMDDAWDDAEDAAQEAWDDTGDMIEGGLASLGIRL